MVVLKNKRIVAVLALLVFVASSSFAQATGKNPVIIIPGITGSTLVNARTGKTAWFSVKRDKSDDLRLPMTSPNLRQDRDNIRAEDIIRKVELPVLPDIEVYQALIDALEARGYHEAKWDRPEAKDVYYVFAYDWRRDNVESAQLLMQRMAAAKRTLRRNDLKFDIIAHSMGGLIARYAAMYGAADLPPDGKDPVPTWAGAPYINKLMMFGTPNEGSFAALDSLLNGYPVVAGRRLPLIDDPRAEDVMSSPAVYQLLPHRGSARFLDESLQPMQVDIYNSETWLKYNWGSLSNPKFLGRLKDAAQLAAKDPEIKPAKLSKDAGLDDRLLSQTTYLQVRMFLSSVLSRAKRFHQALDAPEKNTPIQLYAYGGNCEPTSDAVILIKDDKKDKWQTVFDAKDIKTAAGQTIKKDDVKNAIFALGDGRVTQRSLLTVSPTPSETITGLFTLTSSFFGCGTHTKLFLEKPIQDSFLSALVVEKQRQP